MEGADGGGWSDAWAKQVRQDFPLLVKAEENRDSRWPVLSYLDNAATTLKPSTVLRAIEGFYEDCSASPFRGQHRLSRLSTQIYEAARGVVADFIGAEANEVIFVRNTTEAINLVAASSLFDSLGPGDTIVVPVWEHHSNLLPWQQLCKRTGASLRFLYPDSEGRLSTDAFLDALDERTRFVACAHVSNVLGGCVDLSAVAKKAHAVGALLLADCAQSAAHLALDVHVLDVDFAAFSGHKLYGPMGVGVLYVRRELLAIMEPFLYGGEMIGEVWEKDSSFAEGPKRFEAGTPDVAGALGLASALEYLAALGMERVQARERELLKHLLQGMRALSGLRILGNVEPAAHHAALVSFVLDDLSCDAAAQLFDQEGIAIRAGSQCAQPLHRYLGLPASCRVSPAFYNTHAEIAHFLEVLAKLPTLNLRRILNTRQSRAIL